MQGAKQAPRKGQPNKRFNTSSQKKSSQDGPSPSKKVKKNHPSSTIIDTPPPNTTQAQPTTADTVMTDQSNNATTLEAPVAASDLASTHDVRSMSIISSSHIQQKVTRTLEILSIYPTPPKEKPKVTMLHAKAQCASKAISVVEIAKREIGKEGGKWFQYNKVEFVMVEQKEKAEKVEKGKVDKTEAGGGEKIAGDGEEDVESEEESTAFETMKTPFERANDGKPKMRAVPVMTIYLSRARIDGLRKAYGEQTNALPLQKEKV